MMIDVIVPVFNGHHVLKNCLDSLEKNQQEIENIIIINDASTDTNVNVLIKHYVSNNDWKLINHNKNLGFVKTANEGLKLSKNNSLLLNSDTLVSKHWIRAFKDCLKKVEQLATATAWSNNAEICSFPRFLKNNSIPARIDRLSSILYNNYQSKYPEIPTAVGFCMLITNLAKSTIGYFDENHFGYGYGEENDYSRRAEQAGMKNVLCDNAYVAHVGNVSFADLGLKPDEETMNRLLVKHPDYNDIIHKYIKKDPLKIIRDEICEMIKLYDYDLYLEVSLNE